LDKEAHRRARFTPLGLHRNRVIGCLGGNSPHAPAYFHTPADDINIFDAYRSYIVEQSRRWADESDSFSTALLAAGRFLTGDLVAADLVIDNLPAETVKLDHGAGICLLVPFYALKNALPLPETLHDADRWLQGSPEQVALRSWLAEHRDKLRWVETDGIYRLAP
jgi:hypothetical protein